MATKFEPVRLTNDGGKTFRTATTAAEETRLRFNDGYRSAPAERPAPKPAAPKN